MSSIESKLRYVIISEEDLFVARCLDVEVASDGHTVAAAAASLREALALYFEAQETSFSLELEQDGHQGD